MDDDVWLAARFEDHRTHLRAVAYRMLGSLAEADEAVQDAWLRVSRAGAEGIENLGAWLTTIVARVCLNALQARKLRSSDRVHVSDPIVTPDGALDPEHELLLADSVGLALQIVLDTLPPAERLAFVLHDMFDLPFEEIGPMVGRTQVAARQLASRARRRVQDAAVPSPDADVTRQRRVVDAFFAAARGGDFAALAEVLHPEVVLRSDGGEQRPTLSFVRRGADAIARTAMHSTFPGALLHPVLINGAAGVIVTSKGKRIATMAFTVSDDRIVAIDAVLDPARLARLDLSGLIA